MKFLLFAIAGFLGILLMAVLRIVGTGRIDHHYGFIGSLIRAIPSSAVAAFVMLLAFWLSSLRASEHQTKRGSYFAGAVAGVLSYSTAWAVSSQLRWLDGLAILLPFVAFGMLAGMRPWRRSG